MYRISIVSVVKIIVMFYKITSWFLYSEKYYVLIFLLLFNLFQKEFLKCLFRSYNSIQFFKWLFFWLLKNLTQFIYSMLPSMKIFRKKKKTHKILVTESLKKK